MSTNISLSSTFRHSFGWAFGTPFLAAINVKVLMYVTFKHVYFVVFDIFFMDLLKDLMGFQTFKMYRIHIL